MSREQMRDIAESLLFRLLRRVSWDDCKVHKGGIQIPNQFDEDIESAAAAVKEIGGSWEELT